MTTNGMLPVSKWEITENGIFHFCRNSEISESAISRADCLVINCTWKRNLQVPCSLVKVNTGCSNGCMSRRMRSGVCIQRDKTYIYFRLIRFCIFLFVGFPFPGIASDSTPPLVAERSEMAESPELVIAKGFKVEKLYTVPSEQGSWISLAVDPSGRLIASAQSGLLYRITLGKGLEVPLVEPIRAFVKDKSGKEVGKPVGSAQGLL